MPQIPLHIARAPAAPLENPLPRLLHTPSGLAILELQGTIHFPPPSLTSSDLPTSTSVGKLVFPLYNSELSEPGDTKWMKRVYFYVGSNQRMTGEVKKLGKPFAVIKKKEGGDSDAMMGEVYGDENRGGEELEIVDVVRYKIVFSTRPEPVGGEA
jgi:chromosome transmission fidelity protein 8